jgi:probable phosphoglycerate mutase
MKIFYLVRHGVYENPLNMQPGRLPVKLSAEGIKQAQRLKAYFADKNIARIYSSPVLRCKQTSEIVSGGKIPIVFDLRLAEVFSACQGMWYSGSPDPKEFYNHRKELGGEGFEDLKARMVPCFNEINHKETGNVVICSHSDPLFSLYLAILNRPLTDEIREYGGFRDPDHLAKGAVRPLKIEKDVITPLVMVLQEDL